MMRNGLKKMVATGTILAVSLFGATPAAFAGPWGDNYDVKLSTPHVGVQESWYDAVLASGLDIKKIDIPVDDVYRATLDKNDLMVEVYKDELPVSIGHLTIYDVKPAIHDLGNYDVQYSVAVANTVDKDNKLVCERPLASLCLNSEGRVVSGGVPYRHSDNYTGYFLAKAGNGLGGYFPQIGEKVWTKAEQYSTNSDSTATRKDTDIIYLALGDVTKSRELVMTKDLEAAKVKVVKLHVANRPTTEQPNQTEQKPAQNDAISVNVNGESLAFTASTQPKIVDGTTLLPLRAVADSLDLTTAYASTTKAITITGNDTEVSMQLNSIAATVNGNVITLSVTPEAVNGVTFVPVRFVATAFGCQVDWDAATKTVTISK